jgi:hypothetical protein
VPSLSAVAKGRKKALRFLNTLDASSTIFRNKRAEAIRESVVNVGLVVKGHHALVRMIGGRAILAVQIS